MVEAVNEAGGNGATPAEPGLIYERIDNCWEIERHSAAARMPIDVLKPLIIKNILNWAQFKADRQITKTNGTKRSLTGLPKLFNANNAGTKYAKNCTLILTEGSLAIASLSIVGHDNFEVPSAGELLDVCEVKHDQITKNEEI
ncbi:hypothetical protein C8R44DRAFT_740950 [Mycena epipterygia]|nr:hypothetical protein C8R44DRAFT_740950 [Mycena epipterygia]